MMARPYSELQEKMSSERRTRNEAWATRTMELMTLHELRRERRMNQTEVAAGLGSTQSEVSKIESRTDMKLSTLSEYVKALGGSLQVRAVFPEKSVDVVLVGK